MSAKLGEQIENRLACWLLATSSKPWLEKRKSHRYDKQLKHRTERRAAKKDPETPTHYRKYCGWEY